MKQTRCKLCGAPFVCDNGMWSTTCTCAKDRPAALAAAQRDQGTTPLHGKPLNEDGAIVFSERRTDGKYRKKPVVIEAVQWLNRQIVCPTWPEWFVNAEQTGVINLAGTSLYIKTSEGEMRADVGDWIIRGVKGELYPCKPDIFEATYNAESLTPEEAQAAYDAAVPVPLSDERIQEIVTYATQSAGPQTHEEARQFHEGFLAGATAYAVAVGHSSLKRDNPKLCEVFDAQGWRTIETFEKLNHVCEHGVKDGDWCEPCNKEMKRAEAEATEPDDREGK